jgi:hypothetical protein
MAAGAVAHIIIGEIALPLAVVVAPVIRRNAKDD